MPAWRPLAADDEARASPREEIAQLYARYGHTVTARCRYLLKDEEAAKDAAQEVFVKVMRALEDFRAESSPLTWMLKIATNHCLNLIAAQRARWHERYKAQAAVEESVKGAGKNPLETARQVRRLLGKLDLETQAVAIHYYVDEMTQEEIALALGRSLPTVRKRLEKFHRVAKKELADDLL